MAIEEHLDTQNLDELVTIVNPSPHDYTCTVVDNDNTPHEYTVKSRESLELPRYAAEHVSRKLCKKMLASTKSAITQALQEKTLKNIRCY